MVFAENKITKLIIVCTEETRKYGAYLMQLVGSKDDKEGTAVGLKDGSVEAVLWSEKDYKANLPTLPSSCYILFLGDSKLIKTESTNMNISFNKYGMRFASLGTRAAIYIDKKILKEVEYDEFITLCSMYEKKFDKVKRNFVNTLNMPAKLAVFAPGIFAPVVYPAAIYVISNQVARNKINDQQYTFLTLYTYMEMLAKFLEG